MHASSASIRPRGRLRHSGLDPCASRWQGQDLHRLGGNFVQAAPDTEVTSAALRRAQLTVHVSTKINRSHLTCGTDGVDPADLGTHLRSTCRRAVRSSVSVEDSTCSVHVSRGPLTPASPHLRSEVAIVTQLAEATLDDRYGIDWQGHARRLSPDSSPHHSCRCRVVRPMR
jgi:hypothetical protein